jgi:hypothetical protein
VENTQWLPSQAKLEASHPPWNFLDFVLLWNEECSASISFVKGIIMGLIEESTEVFCRISCAHSTPESLESPTLFPIQCAILIIIKWALNPLLFLFGQTFGKVKRHRCGKMKNAMCYQVHGRPVGRMKLTCDYWAPSFLLWESVASFSRKSYSLLLLKVCTTWRIIIKE